MQYLHGPATFLISAPGFSELGMLLIGLIIIIMPIYCIIDIIRKPGWENTKRLMWVVIVVLMPFIGSIIYLFSRNRY
jgi:hypothetical protein